jgi:hypothetical protein
VLALALLLPARGVEAVVVVRREAPAKAEEQSPSDAANTPTPSMRAT